LLDSTFSKPFVWGNNKCRTLHVYYHHYHKIDIVRLRGSLFYSSNFIF